MFSNVANSSFVHILQNVKHIVIILKVNIVVHRFHGCCLKRIFILLDSLTKTINAIIVFLKDIQFFPTIFYGLLIWHF